MACYSLISRDKIKEYKLTQFKKNMGLASIQTIIDGYRYGQFNILQNPLAIKANPDSKEVLLTPFYEHDRNSKIGSCMELVNAAYQDIRELCPGYFVARVLRGNEPTWFSRNSVGSTHGYLLLAEQDFMGGHLYLDNSYTIHTVATDALVVDPTFGKIVPFSESQYTADLVIRQDVKLGFSKATILKEKQCLPLCFTKGMELMGLCIDFTMPSVLSVAIDKLHKITIYDLRAPELDLRIDEDENAKAFVAALRSTNIVESDEEFVLDKSILI